MAAKKPLLGLDRDRIWSNWHNTSGVGGSVQRLYTPRNVWVDGTSDQKPFLPGLTGLQEIVRTAERDGKRLRALGSGWSLSPVAFTDEYLINTARLGYWFIGFRTPTMLEAGFRKLKDRMVFAQCGVQIKTLNAGLEQRRLALPTSGASNGQTLAGAISTGTHGSANAVGSLQDCVLALDVIAEDGSHYLVQRASRKVATERLARHFGSNLVSDDQLFRALLVSFGSFGLIHGILFAAEPIYLLERHVIRTDFSRVESAIASLDVSRLGLPKGSALPFHFEVVLNPYRLKRGERGAFVRVLYKKPAGPTLPEARPSAGGSLNSEDLVAIAGQVSDAVPDLIPVLLQNELEESLAPTPPEGRLGTHGQQFSDSNPTGGGTSIEIGVPLARAGDALEVLLSVTEAHPFGAPIAFRYVKASQAYLAFTRFAPISCTIELPGIDSARSREAHQRIFAAFRASGIPHTYHWGQALPLEAGWVKAGFGKARVDKWLAARRGFLSPRGRRMFANTLVERCGLSET